MKGKKMNVDNLIPINQAVIFLLNGQLPSNNEKILRKNFYKSEPFKREDIFKALELIRTWNINNQLKITGIESIIDFHNDVWDEYSDIATIHLRKNADKENWKKLFQKEYNASKDEINTYVKEYPHKAFTLTQYLEDIMDGEDPSDWILLSYPSGIDENYI